MDKPKLSAQTRGVYYEFPEDGPPCADQINLAMLMPLKYKAIPFSVTQFDENGKKRMDIKAQGSALGLVSAVFYPENKSMRFTETASLSTSRYAITVAA